MNLTELYKKIDSLDKTTQILINDYINKKEAFHNLRMERDNAQPDAKSGGNLDNYRKLQNELSEAIDVINNLEVRIMESMDPKTNAKDKLGKEKKEYLLAQNDKILDTTDFWVRCFIAKNEKHPKHKETLEEILEKLDKAVKGHNDRIKFQQREIDSLSKDLNSIDQDNPEKEDKVKNIYEEIKKHEEIRDINQGHKDACEKKIKIVEDIKKMDLQTIVYNIDRNKSIVASNLREMGIDAKDRADGDRYNKTSVEEYRGLNERARNNKEFNFGPGLPVVGKYSENSKILSSKELEYLSQIYLEQKGTPLNLLNVRPAGIFRSILTKISGAHKDYNRANIEFLNEKDEKGNYKYKDLFSDINAQDIATLMKAGVTTRMLIDVRRRIQNDIDRIESKDANKFLDSLINWNKDVGEPNIESEIDSKGKVVPEIGDTVVPEKSDKEVSELDAKIVPELEGKGVPKTESIPIDIAKKIEELRKQMEVLKKENEELKKKIEELKKEKEPEKKASDMFSDRGVLYDNLNKIEEEMSKIDYEEEEPEKKVSDMFSDRGALYDNLDKVEEEISKINYEEEMSKVADIKENTETKEELDLSKFGDYQQKMEEAMANNEQVEIPENAEFLNQDISIVIPNAKVQKAVRDAGCNTIQELRNKLLYEGEIKGLGAVTLKKIGEQFTVNNIDIPFIHKLFKKKGENAKPEISDEVKTELINEDYKNFKIKDDDEEER